MAQVGKLGGGGPPAKGGIRVDCIDLEEIETSSSQRVTHYLIQGQEIVIYQAIIAGRIVLQGWSYLLPYVPENSTTIKGGRAYYRTCFMFATKLLSAAALAPAEKFRPWAEAQSLNCADWMTALDCATNME